MGKKPTISFTSHTQVLPWTFQPKLTVKMIFRKGPPLRFFASSSYSKSTHFHIFHRVRPVKKRGFPAKAGAPWSPARVGWSRVELVFWDQWDSRLRDLNKHINSPDSICPAVQFWPGFSQLKIQFTIKKMSHIRIEFRKSVKVCIAGSYIWRRVCSSMQWAKQYAA